MCRFSSVAIRASNWSAIGQPVALPVLRCETRVASSWKLTYAIASSMFLSTSVAGGHVRHPRRLELDRVHSAGHHQVVAQRDPVPALLGGPPADPGAPGAVEPELGGDLPVVRGQVVLGQQVGDHRDLGDRVQPGLLRRPVLAAEEGEVAALAPRHVVVRVPVLGDGQVPLEVLLDDGLQLVQQVRHQLVGHRGLLRRRIPPPYGTVSYATVGCTCPKPCGTLPSSERVPAL